MSIHQQTALARLVRLIQDQCPVHGLGLVRAYSDQRSPDRLLTCPLAECGVTVHHGPYGTIRLSAEYSLLLAKQQ